MEDQQSIPPMRLATNSEKVKSKSWLSISFFVLLLVVTWVAVVLLYQNHYLRIQLQEETTQEINQSRTSVVKEDHGSLDKTEGLSLEEVSEYVLFEGDFILAKLPQHWKIVEYKDGQGAAALMDGFYKGLTGLEIRNLSDEILFQLKAIDGVGGISFCQEVYRFDDTETNFTAKQIQLTNQGIKDSVVTGINTPKVRDLNNDYIELTILGRRVRRLGDKYYWNTLYNKTPFNPVCMQNKLSLEFPILSYEYLGTNMNNRETEYKTSRYNVFFADTIGQEDLVILDNVLNSLR